MMSKLFVGLGNPGKGFQYTRHNVGIRALRAWRNDVIRKDHCMSTPWKRDGASGGAVSDVMCKSNSVICLRPRTFMNRSGDAVAVYVQNHGVEVHDIIVIHDDIELPLGKVQLKQGGSARGHKGVKSIQVSLGTHDIQRLCIGVGRPKRKDDVEKYVLQRFSPSEEKKVRSVLHEAFGLLTEVAGFH